MLDLPDHDPDALHVDDIRSVIRVPQTAAAVLRERGVDAGAIGLAGLDTFLLSHLRAMEAELGHPLELVDADEILERLRLVKSEHGIPDVRRASTVGNLWMRTMMEAIEPGRTEGEVVGEGLRALAAAGFPYDVAIASGDRSRNFQPLLDPQLGRREAPRQGRHRPHRRLGIGRRLLLRSRPLDGRRRKPVGRPARTARGVDRDHRAHHRRGPHGATIGELYDRGAGWLVDNGFGEHRAKLEDAGTDFGQLFPAFGHSVGLGLERPYIIKGDPTLVEENMLLAVEALIGRREVGGAAFEQTLLVTAEGAEVLNADCPSRWWT